MAITTSVCTSYKVDLFNGVHQPTDQYKMALYTAAANLDATTTAYATVDEAAGTGYTTGGLTLTGFVTGSAGTVAFLGWNAAIWTASTITAAGALIYNATRANKSVCVISFGNSYTSSAGDFIVQFSTTALNLA